MELKQIDLSKAEEVLKQDNVEYIKSNSEVIFIKVQDNEAVFNKVMNDFYTICPTIMFARVTKDYQTNTMTAVLVGQVVS